MPLSYEVKKRTKNRSGNPYGRSSLGSWGRRHAAKEAWGAWGGSPLRAYS